MSSDKFMALLLPRQGTFSYIFTNTLRQPKTGKPHEYYNQQNRFISLHIKK